MSNAVRKPRIGLMGEFSAGKSTLSNLLLGARPLPQKVTATRLSPVWLSYGTDAPYRIDVDGSEEPISLEALEEIGVEETRAIRLFFESEILESCDLIDFPGISDPNMSSDVWERMLDEVDAIVWCTHATQAWRQSEAAVWETIPEHIREKSVLLITRFDKLTTDRDKSRVLARLRKETRGLFGATFPIALLEALQAGDDLDAFAASGADAFMQHLAQMIDELAPSQAGAGIAADAPIEAPEESFEQITEAPIEAPVETPAMDAAPVVQDVAPQDPAPQAAPTTAPATEPGPDFKNDDTIEFLPAASATSEKPKALDPSKPVLNIASSEPVLKVDNPTPVSAMPAKVIPKRIKPEGVSRSARPIRPAENSGPVGSEFTDPAYNFDTLPKAEPKQLRSIFKVD